MKKVLSFNYITLFILCQICLCCGMIFTPSASAANNVNNFYFDNFEADYYVTKNDDGTSNLRVVEEFAAVFPDYNQNKGICREIPFTSQGGKNLTLKSLTRSDVKLTRNGAREPIYSIEKESDYYNVCTGTEEYVTGLQIYVFEYNFENVITSFNESGKEWQELYWNTNGTGWKQRFNKVTARVHFENPSDMTGEKWCYVGKAGSNNQSRCDIEKTSDGFEFTASELSSGENLTFDIELKPGVFAVKEPEKDYMVVVIAVIVSVICALLLINPIRKFIKTGDKRRFYEGYFVKPEYAPHEKYTLTEMSAVYMGKQKDFRVALLLQMVVEGKIELIKNGTTIFGKQKWNLHIKSPVENLKPAEKYILEILKGECNIKTDDTFEIKKHSSTSELALTGRVLSRVGDGEAERDGLVTKKFSSRTINSQGVSLLFCIMFLAWGLPVITVLMKEIKLDNGIFYHNGKAFVGIVPSIIVIVAACIITAIVRSILGKKTRKYETRTEAGLEASRYMDGLKLYIEMAEKDRLAFLQSVQGADTSAAGVVKLYEKLLPYAALFGVEESWMKVLEKYYEISDVQAPEWHSVHSGIIDAASLASVVSSVSSSASATTSYSSSSSSSSGGGGGGSSGGGGGGGGGGGR